MIRDKLGIAVIGCGRIGGLRASLSSTHPSVNFLALSDREQKQADVLAQRTGADVVTTDNMAAITDDRVDAVFVSTPEHDHRDSIVAALEAGKAVFVENPIAQNQDDPIIIFEVAVRTIRVHHVGAFRRIEP